MKKGRQITWQEAEQAASVKTPVIAHRHGSTPTLVTRVENCQRLRDTLYIQPRYCRGLTCTCKTLTKFFEVAHD